MKLDIIILQIPWHEAAGFFCYEGLHMIFC